VLRQRVSLRASVTGKAVCNVHESPAARAGNLGGVGKTVEKARDKGLEVNLGVKDLGAAVAHTTQGVSSGVADGDGVILHHAKQDRESLLDQRLKDARLRTLHDSTESSDGGITAVPVLVADVLFNKGHDGLNDIALNTLSVELEGLVSGTRHVVLVVTSVLILAAHGLQENGNNLAGGHASEAEERTSLNTFLLCLE
jgi:hypothetical protein